MYACMYVCKLYSALTLLPKSSLRVFLTSENGGSYTRTRTLEKVMMPAIDTDAVRILFMEASAIR